MDGRIYTVVALALPASAALVILFVSARYVRRKKAQRDSEGVFNTISQGSLRALKEALDEQKSSLSSLTDSHGGSPLHRAALEAKGDMVGMLLQRKSRCNARESMFGFTPLHMLACRGYPPLIAAMHPQINVHHLCADRRTAQEEEVGRLLLEHGADVNCRAGFGRTPLHLAALSGREHLVQLLAGAGAEVDAADDLGFSPLHYAAFSGSEACVGALLQCGVDIDRRARLGYTALHIASEQGRESVVEVLKNSGADLDSQTDHAMTPEALARQHGRLNLAKNLTREP